MAKTQIKKYVFNPGIGAADNLYPNAYSLLSSNKSFIQKEATAWIQDQIDASVAGFVGYTYNAAKCERDIGYNIDAYLTDLRYGGNENTYNVVKYYWDQDVAQIDGSRAVEIATYDFIKTLIQTYILTNTAYSSSNVEVSQTIDPTKTAESGTSTILGNLVQATADVIETGISAFPTFVPTGVGHIKIQGRYDLDQLLLITNVTKNEIIYNFSSPEQGGLVSLKTDEVETDLDFASYLQTTDAITKITLNYNTSTHSSSDEIQVFVEKIENGKSVVTTRPYDFGTDAIERMRVAPALSMLDADFEYGLQPTKWAAIGTLRGYPSVYEIPGTDTAVLSVVTDASAGTNGVGQSLITVTTVSPHGFTPGTPITIKALEDSVVGAARAEGSFVIVTVPTENSFTYFAKSKVGTVSGDVLSTVYTQLRQAGFYTGATIGFPTVTVASNGSAGTLVAELDVAAGSTIIPFDGPSPEVGAPLVNANIPEGAQVTSIVDTSAGGGEYITLETTVEVNPGDTSVEVSDNAGVVPNLAVDRGDGTAIYVTSVAGSTTVNFSGQFNNTLIANTQNYTAVAPNPNTSTGSGAIFNISSSSGIYTLDGIANSGENYLIGDRILVEGTNLGGISPDNDLIIRVSSLDSLGGVETVILEGSAPTGSESLAGIAGVSQGGNGVNALFNVTFENNVYTVDMFSPDNSVAYTAGDIIVIPGTTVAPGVGTSPANDVYVTVDSVGAGGGIVGVTANGTAPDAQNVFNNPTYTTSGVGTGAIFSVFTLGSNYDDVQVDPSNQGINFLPGDTVTIDGADLGGTSITNDLTITIDNVGGNGEITAISWTGVAFNGGAVLSVSGTNRVGSNATFDVVLNAGSYNVTVDSGGTNYGVGQTIYFQGGNAIPGTSLENDLTITVTAVDDISSGVITSVSVVGTAYDGIGTFINLSGITQAITGTGFTLDVTRSTGTYSNIVINTAGSGYFIGNSFTIPGPTLDGDSPINDIDINVTGVDGSGAVTAFTTSFEEASIGDIIRLFSTVVVSEATTGVISTGDSITYGALATLDITFTNAHGLVPGNTFIVDVNSDDGSNNHDLAAGSFFATDIPTINSLRYQARAEGTIDTSTQNIAAQVYPRPDSFFVHRPYDGGVQLGTGGPQHGAQAIRQSKKYIRYQSGKGIMYTTGALFAPSYDLRSVTAESIEVNSLITVVTDDNDHGLQVGGIVRLLGIETPGYNSGPQTFVPPKFDYEVVEVVDERTFKIRSQRRLGATEAVLGFGAQMSVVRWHGATVRSGIFDDQNGIFWEYDGTTIQVAQRTGTRQLSGTIALEVDNNLVTGTNTRFRDQLKAGDRIIIKGMTHLVSHVNSQTECTVTPDWRGVIDISGAKANLIVDKKVKQQDFNLDTLDGNGPSGYDIDIAKMQMIGIQYSWYGAGFIDFMLRGADGNFVFCHRMRNSNINTEAFMRSGNLPVRYEVTNEGPSGKLAQSMSDNQNTVLLEDSSFFPDSGTIYIDNEIITFTGNNKNTNTLTGCTRAATFINFQAGATRSYTAGAATAHDARTGVILISQTITPLISHWGSAFITDGGFDEDRGYIFSYAATGVEVSTTKRTSFLIRLAPSVSNALVGDLGERELLNRAQLLLQSLEVTSDGEDGTGSTIQGGIIIEGVLNPQNYPLNPNDVSWSELSNRAQGGQPSFAQIAPGGAINWGKTTLTRTATVSDNITTGFVYQNRINGERSSPFEITEASYESAGPVIVGSVIFSQNPDAYTPINGRIFRVTNVRDRGNRYEITYQDQFGGSTSFATQNTSTTYSFRYETYTGITNRLLFTQASWESSGAGLGTPVSVSDTNWPAGTAVSNVQRLQLGSTVFYEVQFNQTSVAPLGVADLVTFEFGSAGFALPGETVFSFIATPGERATVDFSTLKELTNTPLGGRGVFPNGPDVLAINVFKVSGPPTNANIILNWGEAQA